MPDLLGLTYTEAESRLHAGGVEQFDTRWQALEDVAANVVASQEPAPGEQGPITLVFSTGGPAVPLVDVPAQAQELARGLLAPGEQVLVVQTDAGTAYKVDAVLFGPCAAVDAAYRTFLDPQYGSPCY